MLAKTEREAMGKKHATRNAARQPEGGRLDVHAVVVQEHVREDLRGGGRQRRRPRDRIAGVEGGQMVGVLMGYSRELCYKGVHRHVRSVVQSSCDTSAGVSI